MLPTVIKETFNTVSIILHKTGHYKMPGMHYHNAYEVFILEDGNRGYIVEDKLISLKPRDVLLIKKDVVHCTVSGEYTSTNLTFPEEYISNFFSPHGMDLVTKCFEKQVIRVREDDFELLLSSIERLYADNDDIWAFMQALIILHNNMSRSRYDFRNSNNKISDAIDYITQNYKTIDNLDDICSTIYISKQHLCDSFKEETGTTIMKYINGLKIHASLELLENKKIPIEEIALQCGFSSSSYFSKVFKSVTGISPAKYRRLKAINKIEPLLR